MHVLDSQENKVGDDEQLIVRRRDEAIRRALNTPPKRLKEFVGKSERAIAQRKKRIIKAVQSNPKST